MFRGAVCLIPHSETHLYSQRFKAPEPRQTLLFSSHMNHSVRLIGFPMDLGAGRRGVDMGPSAIRIAGVSEKLRALGYTVFDAGDIEILTAEVQEIDNVKLPYLTEIARACGVLAREVEIALDM